MQLGSIQSKNHTFSTLYLNSASRALKALAFALGISASVASQAGTYVVDSVTVTHSGGWPSDNIWGGNYTSGGGQVLQNSVKDAEWWAVATAVLNRDTEIYDVDGLWLLERENVDVQFTVKYTQSNPFDPPNPIAGASFTLQRRFSLLVFVGITSGTYPYTCDMGSSTFAYNVGSAGDDYLTYNNYYITTSTAGNVTQYYNSTQWNVPPPTEYNPLVLYGEFVEDEENAGTWYCTFTVPGLTDPNEDIGTKYEAIVPEPDGQMAGNVTSYWQYRVWKANGVTIASSY